MPRVSITRLRLRSAWFELPFAWHALRSQLQARKADGCLAVIARRTSGKTYWTLTLWRDAEVTRAYMVSGAHRTAMPKLMNWCDEASLAHWEQGGNELPLWAEAEHRLANEGRISKVAHPSPAQLAGKPLGS